MPAIYARFKADKSESDVGEMPLKSTTKKGLPSRSSKIRGADHVYSVLRDKILQVGLEPGSKLDEMAIVDEFGCSRTPVREALIRLAAEGLVTMLPNYGARVASLGLLEVAQYFEAFEISQRVANYLAAIRRTESDLKRIHVLKKAFDRAVERDDSSAMIETNRDFHGAISAASQNSHIHAMTLNLLDQGMRLNWLYYLKLNEVHLYTNIDRTRVEHEQLVAAIEAGDAQLAEKIGSTHAATFRDRIADLLATNQAGRVSLWETQPSK